MNNWTIFYSFHDTPLHLDFVEKSNPYADVIPLNIKNEYTQHFAWRNSDNLVRNKVRQQIDRIKTHNVAIAEYDVLINEALPEINIDSIYCKKIMRLDNNKNWHWFKETNRLGPLKEFALGLFPMGFLIMNIEHLNIWIDHQYDFLYEENIFCELRLGTVFNHSKCSIKEYDYPNILTRMALKNQNIPEQDLVDRQNSRIYHPVKNQYES